jgi:hypothetical protein
VAQLILSICLGFVAQRSLAGDADVKTHSQALASLVNTIPSTEAKRSRATPRLRPSKSPR